jgi:hypothetical protein
MKFTGLNELAIGMTDKDFHSLVYLSNGQDITHTVKANEEVSVPIFISVMEDLKLVDPVFLVEYTLEGVNQLGNAVTVSKGKLNLPFEPWMQIIRYQSVSKSFKNQNARNQWAIYAYVYTQRQ